MDTHIKNVEKSSQFGGKFDPYAGLANSGIAGTAPDKDDEDNKQHGSEDIEMKDNTKKEGLYFRISYVNILLSINVRYCFFVLVNVVFFTRVFKYFFLIHVLMIYEYY